VQAHKNEQTKQMPTNKGSSRQTA